MDEQELLETPEEQDFSLEDIMKEFGADAEVTEEVAEEVAEEVEEVLTEALPEHAPQEDAMDGATRALPDLSQVVTEEKEAVTSDTIRLDHIEDADLHSDVHIARPVEDDMADTQPIDPFTASWEPEYEQPMGDYVPAQPIIFHPRSRLRELKKKLIEGPEKQYYALAEKGLGKLQIAIFFSFLLALVAAATTVLDAVGAVPDTRVKLMIFSQFFILMASALLGSFQMVAGVDHLIHKRFSMNTMLVFTFVACCADSVFCLLQDLSLTRRIPCCAAFSLLMTMSLWRAYHQRYTAMGQMDTMRKANHLDGIGVTEDYYESNPGLLRFEGQVEDFMDHYRTEGEPEKRLDLYSMIAGCAALAVGITAGVLGGLRGGVMAGVTDGVQVFAVSMLAALPATALICISRPSAVLERKLHHLGAVICGWPGVKALCGKRAFPLSFEDIFPAGTVKLNGVKFYGSRQPDEIVAYGAAVIEADGGGLTPLFVHLLESRNGHHYPVTERCSYENGGIGGIVENEAVLVGSISFLKEMGVEIPDGIRVSNAVCVAIDGELSGLFAISYEKDRSSAAGLTTLCGYRGLTPVLTAHDFTMSEGFLHSKFGMNTRRFAIPEREERERLAAIRQEAGSQAAVLVTTEGLAPFAYGVTGARALNTAANLGVLLHMIGGGLGLAIMLTLTILGRLDLLSPVHMFLYHLVWMVPGLLITEWTRTI